MQMTDVAMEAPTTLLAALRLVEERAEEIEAVLRNGPAAPGGVPPSIREESPPELSGRVSDAVQRLNAVEEKLTAIKAEIVAIYKLT